jgi:hypothetical protein
MNYLRFLMGLVLSAAAWAALGGGAVAEHPEFLRDYRFLPSESTLIQSGGIAGTEEKFQVLGTFSVVSGFHHDDPWLGQSARFINVDAWAVHPIKDLALSLDQVLNLSGLKGRQLPVAAPFDVFQFQGHTADGSAVNLFASVISPWFFLRGETTPPAGSADYFTYKIDALARQMPHADFDGDGAIDGGDLDGWQGGFGKTMPSAPDPVPFGDANADLAVDGADFLVWQRLLGEQLPPPPPDYRAAAAATTAAPEPDSVALLVAAAAGLLGVARRR